MSTSETAAIPPTSGLVAGKYEIARLIGRGGMGSVWEARHTTLGTKVAIKFVELEHAKNEEARKRFANEARAAASIQSKHAIKVLDHGLLDDGHPYIVMELLLGEPLDRRLAQTERLPLPETARLIQQIARALQQAHDAGITHRDLKPENIFLERHPDDEEDTAKVLDFGIAKLRDPVEALAASASTKTGVLMGTPFYMSPEQGRGLKSVDYRSDLWSLGVITFRCVTGVLPFDGESLGDLLVNICSAPALVPSKVVPGLPKTFDAWMRQALARDPGARFASATDLAEALASVAGITSRSSRRTPDSLTAPATTPSPNLTLPMVPSTSRSPVELEPYAETHPARPVDILQQPPSPVTSSSLTSSATPRAPSRGISVGALTALALGVLTVSVGGTFLYAGRNTAATDLLVRAAAMPPASAPVVTPAPALTTPDPPASSTASSVPTAPPPPPPVRAKVSSASNVGKPPPPPPKTKPPSVASVAPLPKPPNHVVPPLPPGSDPGY